MEASPQKYFSVGGGGGGGGAEIKILTVRNPFFWFSHHRVNCLEFI